MATVTHVATEEDLLRAPEDGFKHELVDGQIRMTPAGYRHGRVSVRLATVLAAFTSERRLGDVLDSSTGFRMPSGNVRLPDVSFVAAERAPARSDQKGFSNVIPDLAIEVLSPGDRPREVLDKVGEYLDSGVRMVWVIDPEARAAVVYRSLSNARSVRADEMLDGEDLVPGFSCPLADVVD